QLTAMSKLGLGAPSETGPFATRRTAISGACTPLACFFCCEAMTRTRLIAWTQVSSSISHCQFGGLGKRCFMHRDWLAFSIVAIRTFWCAVVTTACAGADWIV